MPAKRSILSSIEGQYLGPTPSILPVYIGENSKPVRKISCTSLLVQARKQLLCFLGRGVLVNENLDGSSSPGCSSSLEKSIAVLPFTSLSDDPEKQYQADGVMDAILLHLSKIEDLRVMSRTSVEQYRNTEKTIAEICEELDVAFALEGSFRKYNDQARLIVQLIQSGKEDHVWANQYDREWKDIFTVESEVAQSIAKELQVIIIPKAKQLIEKIATTDLTALDYFQRGREEHMKHWMDNANRQSIKDAIALYRMALKHDTTFAQAYTGMALAHSNIFWANRLLTSKFSPEEHKIYQDSILSLVDHALEYNNDLEEAYFVRGQYYTGIQEYDKALLEFEKAIEINPNYAWAYDAISHVWFDCKMDWVKGINYKLKTINLERGAMLPTLLGQLGRYYEHAGFNNKAIDLYNQIFELTHDTIKYYEQMSGPSFCDGAWDESIEWCKKIIKKDSDKYWPHSQLIGFYYYFRNIDSAVYHMNRLIDLKENMVYYGGDFDIGVGAVEWELGKRDEATIRFERAIEYYQGLIDSNIEDRDYSLLQLCQVYSIQGQNEKALNYLNQIEYHISKHRWVIVWLEMSPYFDALRTSEDFQQILNTMNTLWQNEHERVRQWLEENDML